MLYSICYTVVLNFPNLGKIGKYSKSTCFVFFMDIKNLFIAFCLITFPRTSLISKDLLECSDVIVVFY